MHAGNIYAALVAWLEAKSQGGRMLLRIEDLDASRSRKAYADQIMRDFEMLGLYWDVGPLYQSRNTDAYNEAYRRLEANSHIYPCFCTRAEINAASAMSAVSAASAPNGAMSVYTGTCRNLTSEQQADRLLQLKSNHRTCSYRIEVPDAAVGFEDGFQGRFEFNLARDCGDFTLKRSDGQFAYQLAVVVDDAASNVSSVVRGVDLIPSCAIQDFLYGRLGYAKPSYCHVPLFCDESGSRLAKRNKSAELGALIDRLGSVEAVVGHIAYVGLLQEKDVPTTPENLLAAYDHDGFASRVKGVRSIRFE